MTPTSGHVSEANPLHSWQAPPHHHQGTEDEEGPPTECRDQEPRGRKRHQRSHSTILRVEERGGGEVHPPLGPSTPKRCFLRSTSRRRLSRTPTEGILQSAKRVSRDFVSRDFLTSPSDPGCDEKNDSKRHRYKVHGGRGSPRPRETREYRPVSTPTAPSTKPPHPPITSRKYKSKASGHGRRASTPTCPETPNRSHRTQARDCSPRLVSPMHTSSAQDTTGNLPYSRSDLSDLDGDLAISRMDGLLDIWDSTENPNWEDETFALCDLEHCRRCGKYYVLMRTIRHNCRN